MKRIPDLRLVVFDSLQAFVAADVNADPAAAQFLWSSMAELSSETGATTLLLHHLKKEGLDKISTLAAARAAIRGTTALVDGARSVYVLWPLSEESAAPICDRLDTTYERGKIVQGGIVKANDEHDTELHTYQRQDSGLLQQVEYEPNPSANRLGAETAKAILQRIQEAWNSGAPYAKGTNSDRYAGLMLMHDFGLPRLKAAAILKGWFDNGTLASLTRDKKTKAAGLKVMQWPT